MDNLLEREMERSACEEAGDEDRDFALEPPGSHQRV